MSTVTAGRWLAGLCFCGLMLGTGAARYDCHAQDDYEAWRARQQQQFRNYISEQDRQFSDWLEDQWSQFEAMQGLVRDEAPKPEDVPVAPVPEDEPAPPPPRRDPPPPPRKVEPVDRPEPPAPTPPPHAAAEVLEMDFYGRALEIPRLDLDGVRLAGRIDEKVISGFWETMSGLPHDDLLTHAATLAEDLHLNDWGRLLLLNGIAHGQFEDRNLIVLATWFYLLKSGYDARIGFWEGRVYLMLPAEQKIYGHTNFTLEGCRYYVVEPGGGASKPQKLMIFEGDYPGARRALDLRLAELPRVGNDPYSRELRFAFAGKDYAFDLRYDNRAIEFLASFPLTDLDVYFTAPISGDLSRTLLGALRPALDGLSIRESVDLLLRLVQTGFAYKTDGDQFGREKYMFPEELLFFPYSDCEDRSVLFHYLVETLLGLDVVGLAYPGHVATAVDFQRTQVGGDALTYDNRRYVICDPTYINAGAGMCMPRFQGTSPEVLNFE